MIESAELRSSAWIGVMKPEYVDIVLDIGGVDYEPCDDEALMFLDLCRVYMGSDFRIDILLKWRFPLLDAMRLYSISMNWVEGRKIASEIARADWLMVSQPVIANGLKFW